jgi:folate-binding protein YgfZ
MMKNLSATELPDYSLIRISGADRTEFLQGQLTQDINAVTGGKSSLTGWATAKGRLLMTGQLLAWQGSFFLPVPKEISASLIRKFTMFILRAKVTVDAADYRVAGIFGLSIDRQQQIGGLTIDPAPGTTVATDEICIARLMGDPSRAWLIGEERQSRGMINVQPIDRQHSPSWELSNIRAGLPVIRQATSEAFVPQMVNLDLIGGISFTKGCYIGQEIVSRTQNLGRIKRRMYLFATDAKLEVSAGMSIYGTDGATGKIVAAAHSRTGTEILAVIAIADSDARWFADHERSVLLVRNNLPYAIPG